MTTNLGSDHGDATRLLVVAAHPFRVEDLGFVDTGFPEQRGFEAIERMVAWSVDLNDELPAVLRVEKIRPMSVLTIAAAALTLFLGALSAQGIPGGSQSRPPWRGWVDRSRARIALLQMSFVPNVRERVTRRL